MVTYWSKPFEGWWERTRPEMYHVIADAVRMKVIGVAMTKRNPRLPLTEITDNPALWGKVALIDGMREHWPTMALGPIGCGLGLMSSPAASRVSALIEMCRPLSYYQEGLARMRADLAVWAPKWRDSYLKTDTQARSEAQLRVANRKEYAALVQTDFVRRELVYNGRRYEDDPRALSTTKARIKAPEPYFSGTSSPQAW